MPDSMSAARPTPIPVPLAPGAGAEIGTGNFGKVVGSSPQIRELFPLFRRLATSELPVVIEGETGTGKEVLAESLHQMGPRSAGPFVVFDCTAVAPNLVESALFGHERGSFTGATEARRGYFEEANGGTLLLDEIGDLQFDLQAKLLRVLERAEVRRVGSNRSQRVDVRIMAATRRSLRAEVDAGRFRDDLYYRLSVTRVELPPLRDREGDIPVLARHFWQRHGGTGYPPPEFVEQLEARPWPGNVREMHNAVARRVAFGTFAEAMDHTGSTPAPAVHPGEDAVERILAQDLPFPEARRRLVAEFEDRYIERLLERHKGNVGHAAAAAGIADRYFRLLRARSRERNA